TFPAIVTGRRAVTHYALGIALGGPRPGTLLAGLSVDESPVSGGDGLFTRLDTSTLGLGYYWPLHNGALSAGLAYRAGSAAAVRLHPVAGLASPRAGVTLQTLRLMLGWGLHF
ncbi:MAG: hypothetical protein HY342_03130, partial [Candidatus Lambdaproteobacteria bacterium]|nr:hypothetical protein [Candidatus Lambdaproteobacteria bacterium]